MLIVFGLPPARCLFPANAPHDSPIVGYEAEKPFTENYFGLNSS